MKSLVCSLLLAVFLCLFVSSSTATEERRNAIKAEDKLTFHLDNYLQDKGKAHTTHKRAAHKAGSGLWFHLDALIEKQEKTVKQGTENENQQQDQDQQQQDQQEQVHENSLNDESSGTAVDPDAEKSYVKEKSGGTTTVIANRNFMSIMEEPDFVPPSAAQAADEARMEAEEQAAKKGSEERSKKFNVEYRSKQKADESQEKQKRKEAEAESGRKKAEEEVVKAQEGAKKTNDRTAETAQKKEERDRQEQRAKADKCKKKKINPSNAPGEFTTPIFNYPNGWNFEGNDWTFTSRAAVVGDFNGDGFSDFARLAGKYIHFFISQGNGDYWWPIYPFPQGWDFSHNEDVWTTIAPIDLNGDGKTDVVRTYGNYNHGLLSTGSDADCWKRNGWVPNFCMDIKTFQYPYGWNFRGEWHFNHDYTLVADFNGDGKGDFARLGSGYMHMFISKGDGSYFFPIYRYTNGWSTTLNPNDWKVASLDINGDCRADIVLNAPQVTRAMIVQGSDDNCWKKDGWVGAECFNNVQWAIPNGWNFAGPWIWNSGAYLRGDFNADGKADFVRLGDVVSLFFISKGDGTYYTPVYRYPQGWNFGFDENGWTTLPPGDFDGDGKVDMIRTSGTYHHAFFVRGSDTDCWFKNGEIPATCMQITTFRYPGGWNFVGYWTWNSVASKVADFNGDGRDDYINLRGGRYNHQFIAK